MTFRKHHHCQCLSPLAHPTSACPTLPSPSYPLHLLICFFHLSILTDRKDMFSRSLAGKKIYAQVRSTWTSEGDLQGSALGLFPLVYSLLSSVPASRTFPFHSQPCAPSSSHLVTLHFLPVPVSSDSFFSLLPGGPYSCAISSCSVVYVALPVVTYHR